MKRLHNANPKKKGIPSTNFDHMKVEISAFGNFIFLGFGIMIFPSVILEIISNIANTHLDYNVGSFFSDIQLPYLYFAGVYATYNHWKWRKNKIPHLL